MPQVLSRPAIALTEERGSSRKHYYLTHPQAIGASNPIHVSHEICFQDGRKAIADMMLPFYSRQVMQRLLSSQLPGADLGNVVREDLAPTPF